MADMQIREYRIAPGRLDDFVAQWTDHVVPLRRAHGFEIVGAWAIHSESRFVWVLSHPGPGTFEDADAAYYASSDRTSLDPDPATLIVEAGEHPATPIV